MGLSRSHPYRDLQTLGTNHGSLLSSDHGSLLSPRRRRGDVGRRRRMTLNCDMS